jgi:hypothetical protein
MTTSVRIFGQDQVDAFRAICALAGRHPHELAVGIILEAILQSWHDHEVQHLVYAVRRHQTGLRLVYGGPGSAAGRDEMLGAVRDDTAGAQS